jgi:hypothetical protein
MTKKQKQAATPKATMPKKAPPDALEPEVVAEEQESETVVVPAVTDNVGDISIEVNVEDLIARIEAESKGDAAPSGSARRKIEDILEEKRIAREIMDLDDLDI